MNPSSFEPLEFTSTMENTEQAKRLQESWKNVYTQIQSIPMVTAPPGFSNRFKASLEARRLEQQRHQTRVFAAVLLGVLFLVSILLGVWMFFEYTPTQIISTIFQTITGVLSRWEDTSNFLRHFLQTTSPVILIGGGIVLLSWFSLIGLTWAFTVWRISIKGVHVK